MGFVDNLLKACLVVGNSALSGRSLDLFRHDQKGRSGPSSQGYLHLRPEHYAGQL